MFFNMMLGRFFGMFVGMQIVAVRDEGAGVVAGNLERARIDEVRLSLPAWRHRVLTS